MAGGWHKIDLRRAAGILHAALLAALFFPAPCFAHTGFLHSEQTTLKGRALDVGISPGGIAYIVDPDGAAWRWGSSFGEEWSFAGGTRLVRIDVGPDNRPWAVDRDGGIFFYNSAYWERRGSGAVDVGVGPGGVVLALLKDGGIVGWDPATRRFRAYVEATGSRIDVDGDGRPWIVDDDGRLARYTGAEWQFLETVARDVSVSPGGEVFVAGDDGKATLHLTEAIGQDVPGFTEVVSLSAGPDGHLWAVREDRSIIAMSLFEEERGVKTPALTAGPSRPSMEEIQNIRRRRQSSVDAARITSNAPLEFVLVTGILATDIGIGSDGSVFATDTNGRFARFRARTGAFLSFPGQISAVAVDSGGNPWGVTPAGDVFRHNGRDWTEITGAFETARDIAINHRDAVFLTGTDDRVFRFDAERNRFVLFPGLSGARIAVDANGRPWTVDSNGAVFRCDGDDGCTRTPAAAAADIGIGPDGSVFITSKNNDLLRFDRREQGFEFLPRVSTGVTVVAVGPRGRPWVIDTNNRVFASGFFDRDESDDLEVARNTRTETSSVPTIVFTKRLILPRFADVRRRIGNAGTVRAARNGEVIVTADDGTIWRFDKSKKRFDRTPVTAPLIAQGSGGPPVPITAVSPDGLIVILDSVVGATTTRHRILRQKKLNRPATELLVEITLGNDNSDGRIHVGPEGTVYFSIIEVPTIRSRLFIAEAGSKTLRELDVAHAGVDPVRNFHELIGGGQENVLHNAFLDTVTGRTSIQLLENKKFDRLIEVSSVVNGFSSNENTFYACIDTVLSKLNKLTNRFDGSSINCNNVAVTPEGLIFYIRP